MSISSVRALQSSGAPTYPAMPVDYFASNGASSLWTVATLPNAFYDATGNSTWVVWEGYVQSVGRGVFVRVYNHGTSTWSAIYLVSTSTSIVNDDHGVPSVEMDANGYVHVFFGSHASPMYRCTSTNPRDPSAWNSAVGFGVTISYPHPTVVGSTLYCFVRFDNPLSDRPLALYPFSVGAGGVLTLGSTKVIADFGANTRWYQGPNIVRGTDIHMIATKADSTDVTRQGIYYLIFDTTTGTVRNWANSFSVVAGSQPMNLATLDANFRIVDQPVNNGNVPSFCFDSSGAVHIAYMDGASSVYNLYHITAAAGGAFSSPFNVGTFPTSYLSTPDQHRYDGFCAAPATDGGVDFYWVVQGTPIFDRGGNMGARHRSPGGAWGSQSTLRASTTFRAFDGPVAVRNANANLRMMFGEVAPVVATVAVGVLKGYAYGDAGYAQA